MVCGAAQFLESVVNQVYREPPISRPEGVLSQQDAGESGDQGAVEVEEGADLGPWWACLDFGEPSRAAALSEGLASVPAGHRMAYFQLASPLVDDRCGSFAGSGVNDAGVARPLSGPPSASTSLKPSNRHCANRPPSVIEARS